MQLYWKRDSGTGVFPWILRNFLENIFYRTYPGDCFCPFIRTPNFVNSPNISWLFKYEKILRLYFFTVFCKQPVLESYSHKQLSVLNIIGRSKHLQLEQINSTKIKIAANNPIWSKQNRHDAREHFKTSRLSCAPPRTRPKAIDGAIGERNSIQSTENGISVVRPMP